MKSQLVGTIQRPGQKPQNVDIVVDKRPNITRSERAAGIEWVNGDYEPGDVRRYGENTTPGTTLLTVAIQSAIDVMAAQGGGKAILPDETCLTDTLYMKDNVHLVGGGPNTVLSFTAHSLTHNPVIRIGGPNSDQAATGSKAAQTGVGPITGARVSDFKIDGNSTNQTGTSDEWSAGVWIWQSDNNRVERLEITDCQGDGVTIGYDSAAQVGSDGNTVRDCEIYGNARQPIAITYGNENNILDNRISGAIDLEIDASIGECKNNLVRGNKGRAQTESLTAPRISDLLISTATLNTAKSRTSGNIITQNHCYQIKGDYNSGLTVTNNYIVGSNSTQVRLLDFAGVDYLKCSDNVLIANTSVATSLADILRTRAGQHISVTNNTGNDGGLPFHNYTATFGAEPSAAGHYYHGNILDGGGDYRTNNSCPFLTEESVYKIQSDGANPQVFTITHVSGPHLDDLSAAPTGSNLRLDLNWASGESFWQPELFAYGEVGASAEPYDETVIYSVDINGSARDISVYTAPLGATLTYAQYNFANSGSSGTIFVRFRY